MKLSKIEDFKLVFETFKGDVDQRHYQFITTNNPKVAWIPKTLTKMKELMYDFPMLEEEVDKLEDQKFFENFDVIPTHSELLRDYQNKVVNIVREKKNYGLFMEQRLGKTPTAVTIYKDYDKVVVAVPNGLQMGWKASSEKFGGRDDIVVVKGTPAKRVKIYEEFKKAKTGILIGSVDTLAKDTTDGKFNVKHDYQILDEAHFLRNKTQKTKGMLKIRKLSKYALALTGTPSTNHSKDVLPILMYINPNKFSKWGIIEYFFDVVKGKFNLEIGDIKIGKEIEWAEFLNSMSIIMKQKDYMHWLPEITKEKVVIEMNTKQRKLYKDVLNKFKWTDDKGKTHRTENIMTQMSKLIEIGLDTRVIDIDGGGAKTKWIKEHLELEGHEPTIIWTNSRKYVEILTKELAKHKPMFLHGGVKAMDRKKVEDDFNAGKSNVLICMTSVASTGFTLDRATKMIFLDRNWSAVDTDQSNARFVPTDEHAEKKARIIIDLQCEDSMDELVELANINKWKMTEITNKFNEWLEK